MVGPTLGGWIARKLDEQVFDADVTAAGVIEKRAVQTGRSSHGHALFCGRADWGH